MRSSIRRIVQREGITTDMDTETLKKYELMYLEEARELRECIGDKLYSESYRGTEDGWSLGALHRKMLTSFEDWLRNKLVIEQKEAREAETKK